MRSIILTTLFLLSIVSTYASEALIGMSAVRAPHEDYKDVAKRYFRENPGDKSMGDAISAYQARTSVSSFYKKLEKISDVGLPDWNSDQLMNESYNYVRDTRMLDWVVPSDWPLDNAGADFPRRITWLYPDDGCYARAEMMVNSLEKSIKPLKMRKIFVFGNLVVDTDNASSGQVSWWYHVAPIVKNNGKHWVFDPAINPHGPMLVEDWFASMLDDGNSLDSMRVSICSSHTFIPNSDCIRPYEYSADQVVRQMQGLLRSEYVRLYHLPNRNADEELGEHPPWLGSHL